MNTARLLAPAVALLLATQAQATAIRLEPSVSTVAPGTAFEVRIVADIDPGDEIIGFGFDLFAPAGVSLVGFQAGPGFADDPVYLAPLSDGDGIRGASAGDLLFGPAVSGNDLVLGILTLAAADLGPIEIGLTADDLAFNYTEGLIPLSLNLVNFMPAVTPAALTVATGTVPTPGTAACTALALLAALAPRRRRRPEVQPSRCIPSA